MFLPHHTQSVIQPRQPSPINQNYPPTHTHAHTNTHTDLSKLEASVLSRQESATQMPVKKALAAVMLAATVAMQRWYAALVWKGGKGGGEREGRRQGDRETGRQGDRESRDLVCDCCNSSSVCACVCRCKPSVCVFSLSLSLSAEIRDATVTIPYQCVSLVA